MRLTLGRGERDQCRQHVEEEGSGDQFPVADLIHDDAADDDAEAEAGEARAADRSELCAGESEVSSPVRQDASADAEADAGGEDGEEACPEKPFGVRDDAWVVGICEVI